MKKYFLYIFLVAMMLFYGQVYCSENRLALGYVGSFSKMPVGVSFMAIKEKGIGGYIDFKMGNAGVNDDNVYENISRNQAENIWNDALTSKAEKWMCFDAGITKLIHKDFGVYSGLGYYKTENYRQYYDKFEILGNHGKYWIEDSGKNKAGININVGAFYILSRSCLAVIGYDTASAGINLGVSFIFSANALNAWR